MSKMKQEQEMVPANQVELFIRDENAGKERKQLEEPVLKAAEGKQAEPKRSSADRSPACRIWGAAAPVAEAVPGRHGE